MSQYVHPASAKPLALPPPSYYTSGRSSHPCEWPIHPKDLALQQPPGSQCTFVYYAHQEQGVPGSAKNTPESLLLATACKREDQLYLTHQDVFTVTMMLHLYY